MVRRRGGIYIVFLLIVKSTAWSNRGRGNALLFFVCGEPRISTPRGIRKSE
jgi:hypothetical protein